MSLVSLEACGEANVCEVELSARNDAGMLGWDG